MPKKPAGGGKFVKATDAVSDDRNWIGRIQNELNCTATWQKDWGFLSGGTDNISVENATKNYSIDDKIRMIEEAMEKINVNQQYATSSKVIGRGQNLDIFQVHDYNKLKNPELKAQDRKLPKEWKKEKWKAPDDPFDELKNLFKKKK